MSDIQSPPGQLTHPQYRPDIDGLRAVAILSVVGFHAFPATIRAGFVGVDIFFVISGFLISTIIYGNLERNTFSFVEFYSRRIRRIFPALLIVLIASFVFGWFALLGDEYKQLGKHIAAGAGLVSNFVLRSEGGYFDTAAEAKPLLHLWSLGIEEQFYIVWPLLIWAAWKTRFNFLTITVSLALISFALNLRWVHKDAIIAFYSPQSRFWELLVGSVLAWITLHHKATRLHQWLDRWLAIIIYARPPKTGGRTLLNVQAWLGVILIVIAVAIQPNASTFPGWWAVLPTFGAALVISAGMQAWVNHTILANRILVWFGLISYPLYLWHWPLLSFAQIIEGEVPARHIRFSAIVLSIILAWLTYRIVERPVRFGKHNNTKVIVLSALMLIIGFVGFDLHSRDGYQFRQSINDYHGNKNELIRTSAIEDNCLKYVANKDLEFPYCRFNDIGSNETIAVIGDSHAHVAFPGIAELLAERGKNTIMIANSGCPTFLGVPTGPSDTLRDVCRKNTVDLLGVIAAHKDITKVLIFTRGSFYMTGTEPVAGSAILTNGFVLSATDFKRGLQSTVDMLNESGKKVYYVSENPELKVYSQSCLTRPFRALPKDCAPDKEFVEKRQSDYRTVIKTISGITLVDSLNVFCPQDKCIVFNDGKLLYADDDHLSVEGSRFQANYLLNQFLH